MYLPVTLPHFKALLAVSTQVEDAISSVVLNNEEALKGSKLVVPTTYGLKWPKWTDLNKVDQNRPKWAKLDPIDQIESKELK